MNIIFHEDQVGDVESFNATTPRNIVKNTFSVNATNNNRITAKPAKSYILEVFSSTTEFTPLMSSIGITMNPTTMATPTEATVIRTTASSILKKNKLKQRTTIQNNGKNSTKEDDNVFEDKAQNRQEPEIGTFSSYAGFLPFLKSIQSTLMQKAHKSIKSKIQVLTDLRDNLLHEINQRIQTLWNNKEQSSEARGYKEDYSHMDFPSNEAALITLGFLTLAVFLVKLVLVSTFYLFFCLTLLQHLVVSIF